MSSPSRRATIVGVGLIGGSLGLALKGEGWLVSAVDSDPETAAEAVRVGAADTLGWDPESDLTIIAAPVGVIAELVQEALEQTRGVVTDVGSTKASICSAVQNPRFVGGHPMAGSEQDGISGAKPDLFSGAMWVLTPGESTDEGAFSLLRGVVRSVGAETIALPAELHDQMVAQVSHVPHLTAAALMNLAQSGSVEHRSLLRLAAGGFRDMTRISAGRPTIWPDICVANQSAIVRNLDQLIGALEQMRKLVADQDRTGLLGVLEQARTARVNLPVGYGHVENVVELAVPIPDRPGEIAAIATLAAELDVNILDLEITHSGEGRQGIMMLIVDARKSERFVGGLMARQYRPTVRDVD